jgi:hypothetical protein
MAPADAPVAADAPVFVTHPPRQIVHSSSVERFEYIPAAQGVHDVAPAAVPVSVIEPIKQVAQSVSLFDPVALAYFPGAHEMHDVAVDTLEYFPESHAVQLTAPVLVPVFVSEPSTQVTHATVDTGE